MKIIHVVGARPNFMKMAPVFKAIKLRRARQRVIHTGQHYSHNMSDIFFEELELNPPDINLGVGSGSQSEQVAEIMKKIEKILEHEKPDIVVVYGDVNSTLAASLVCAKQGVRLAHVEAGLRSGDRRMPEEINRIVTDRLANILFTPSPDGDNNLLLEGIPKKQIYYVGNVMIDTLIQFLPSIKKPLQLTIPFSTYGVLTLHRPSNVDDPRRLTKLITELGKISKKIPLVFPIHPRTKKCLAALSALPKHIHCIDPLGYLEFLNLAYHSTLVITDSGGIQEETTYLGLPCLTLRENTELPITIDQGTNTLIGNDYHLLHKKVDDILLKRYKKGCIPAKWDGKSSTRIAAILCP